MNSKFSLFQHRKEKTVHWKDSKELHRVMRDFPGIFRAILLKWLVGQLQSSSLTGEELEQRFAADFCEQTPRILILSGMGYRPESGTDLTRYLELFVEQNKLVLDEGKYWLVARS